MKLNYIIILISLLSIIGVYRVESIYEEDAGIRDWGIQNIGVIDQYIWVAPNHLLFQSYLPKSNSESPKYILGFLNLLTNKLKWRQILPTQEESFEVLSSKGEYFLTISGENKIRYWNRNSGELIWSHVPSVSTGVCYSANIMNQLSQVRIICEEMIITLSTSGGNVVSVVGERESKRGSKRTHDSMMATSNTVFKILDESVEFYKVENGSTATGKLVHLQSLPSGGSLSNQYILLKKQGSLVFATQDKLLVLTKSNFVQSKQIAWSSTYEITQLTKTDSRIKSLDQVHSDSVFSVILDDNSRLLLELVDGKKIVKLDIKDEKNRIYSEIDNTDTIRRVDSSKSDWNPSDGMTQPILYAQPINNSINSEYSLTIVYSNGGKKEIGNLPSLSVKGQGAIKRLILIPPTNPDDYEFLHVLVVAQDWSISMYTLSKSSKSETSSLVKIDDTITIKKLWHREEALSFILQSEIIDFPLPDISKLSQLQYEFNETEGFVSHFTRRITTQLSSIAKSVFGSIPNEFLEPLQLPKESAYNQKFQTKKMIIVVTLAGKVYGISSQGGDVLWGSFYPEFSQQQSSNGARIYITKKVIHYPPEAAIVFDMKPVDGQQKMKISFINPLHGVETHNKIIGNPVLHSSLLRMSDYESNRQVLMFVLDYPPDQPYMVKLLPWNDGIRQHWEQLKTNYFYLVNKTSNVITGHTVQSMADGKHGSFMSVPLWNINFGSIGQRILTIGSSNPDEIIQSPAVILGNRNLMPKHLNRNIISVATIDSKSTLYIHIIDSVSGELIKTLQHPHTSSQVSIVHVENSIVYSFFDLTLHKQLISSIDIFEKDIKWKETTYSSFKSTPSSDLIINQKTFVFPSHIKTLSLSITAKGITSKNILIGLITGQVVPIDKKWIDSRRTYPNEATPNDQEEGIIPYHSKINFPYYMFITQNTSVPFIRSMESKGFTDLESTTIVLIYGLDVFCTLVTPSLPYDILSDSFNHSALIITSLFLITLTIITKNWKNSLYLKKKWK
eukprot:gene6178-7692_t